MVVLRILLFSFTIRTLLLGLQDLLELFLDHSPTVIGIYYEKLED